MHIKKGASAVFTPVFIWQGQCRKKKMKIVVNIKRRFLLKEFLLLSLWLNIKKLPKHLQCFNNILLRTMFLFKLFSHIILKKNLIRRKIHIAVVDANIYIVTTKVPGKCKQNQKYLIINVLFCRLHKLIFFSLFCIKNYIKWLSNCKLFKTIQ